MARLLPAIAVGLLMVSAHTAVAQVNGAAQARLPEFEVATIKPVDRNRLVEQSIKVYPGGRVVIRGYDLKTLIMIAFNVSWWQIEGGEKWSEQEQFNVEGKAPESAQSPDFDLRYSLFGIDDDRLRQMLQALLIDRFQLKFHRGTRPGTVYLLERSGKPLRLKPADTVLPEKSADADTFGSIGWTEGWVLSNTTMPHLAKFGADFYMHHPVLDRTGLAGAFNYRSPHEDADSQGREAAGSFENMIKDVGLKLTPTKGSIETFVIDHAQEPSPN